MRTRGTLRVPLLADVVALTPVGGLICGLDQCGRAVMVADENGFGRGVDDAFQVEARRCLQHGARAWRYLIYVI
ncbi:MAG: hypothetical protein IH999_01525 [Proteobacteria bacterium]|nr:hypothetical protein [Pseudomonadota bacterium]